MMAKLAGISGRKTVKALNKIGYFLKLLNRFSEKQELA